MLSDRVFGMMVVIAAWASYYTPAIISCDASPTAATAPSKLAPPTAADQQRASQLVHDVYRDELATARQPSQKDELAQKLLKLGTSEQHDSVQRFVLLSLARDMACEAGDVKVAFAAVVQIDQEFDVDGLKLKTDAAYAALHHLASPQARKTFINVVNSVIQRLITADRYDLASRLADWCQTAARGADDAALERQAVLQARHVHEISKEYELILPAQRLLQKDPQDAQANLKVGRFRCLIKNDWDNGLLLLDRSIDPALQKLAHQDLAAPRVADQQLAIADAWWTFSTAQSGLPQLRSQQRACHWYEMAQANLSGFELARAQKRIAIIQEVASPQGMEPPETTSITRTKTRINLDATVFKSTGTTLSGVQSDAVRTLSPEDGKPYLLQGEYHVPEGMQLEIEAGVIIVCAPRSQLTVNGTLLIHGAADKPVEIRGTRHQFNWWKGLVLNGVKETKLQSLYLSDAEVGIAIDKSRPIFEGCVVANNTIGLSIGHYSSDTHAADLNDCVVSFNKSHGISMHGSSASITSCTITHNGGYGIDGAYYVNPTLKDTIISLNSGGGIHLSVYDSKVVADGCFLAGNRGVEIKNESSPEWDLRGNYWGPGITALLKKRGAAVLPLPNISGKVQIDPYLDKMPDKCGASIKEINGSKLW